MKDNPLIHAVDIFDHLLSAEIGIQNIINGDNDFDAELNDKVYQLIESSWNAVYELSSRARIARLNLIWKQFLEENK